MNVVMLSISCVIFTSPDKLKKHILDGHQITYVMLDFYNVNMTLNLYQSAK